MEVIMILTDRQKKLRQAFREAIIDYWKSEYQCTRMFGVVIECKKLLGGSEYDVEEELKAIPSIGFFGSQSTTHVWMGRYYAAIANALWDGKSKNEVLALWAKTKRAKTATPKRDEIEKKELSNLRKSRKKLRAIAVLHKNMPDRWDKTDWNKCK
jgi:hypothetical protein